MQDPNELLGAPELPEVAHGAHIDSFWGIPRETSRELREELLV